MADFINEFNPLVPGSVAAGARGAFQATRNAFPWVNNLVEKTPPGITNPPWSALDDLRLRAINWLVRNGR